MLKPLLVITLVVFPFALALAQETAEIYRTVDEDGNVVYTDTPPSSDAEPVELGPINTVPSTTPEADLEVDLEQGGDGDAPAPPAYQALEFVYPPADATIRHNGGQVPFRLALQPEAASLADSHQVEIVLDGAVRGRAGALNVTVGPVNRGPHEVSARIVDADGNVLASSDRRSFFLLRHSAQAP